MTKTVFSLIYKRFKLAGFIAAVKSIQDAHLARDSGMTFETGFADRPNSAKHNPHVPCGD